MIDAFLQWKAAANISAGTLRDRRLTLTAFNNCTPLNHATHLDVIDFLNQPGKGPARRKSNLSTLRTFYAWANNTGRIMHNPTKLVSAVRQPIALPKPTPRAAILNALATSDSQTCFMLMLGWRAGLRLSEIARFHSRNITDLGLFMTGKGQRERLIPIHADLHQFFDFHGYAFPSPVNNGRPVFSDYVADRVKAATGYTTHGLRHRFATDAYTNTLDLRAVQELMGHSTVTTTQRYVALADNRLVNVINSLH